MTIEKQLADALRAAEEKFAYWSDRLPITLSEREHAIERVEIAHSEIRKIREVIDQATAALAAYDARPVAGDEQLDAVAKAIEAAENTYSRDFGLHDYSGYGKARPHVMRDYRIREGSQAIFESDAYEEAQDFYERHKRHTIARAAIAAMGAALPPQGDGLAELRVLSAEAAPGMWKAEQWGDGSSHVDSLNVVAPDSEVVLAADMFKGDAAFIVACVNHVRAEIERGGR